MHRGYQYGFSDKGDEMFDQSGRQKKAITMIKILSDFLETPLDELSVLNVGGSTGFIDEYLSRYCKSVIGVDIDEKAISYARQNFKNDNLTFEVGDAMNLHYEISTFDVVVCSQVYEHVPDAEQMMSEIFRVLKPGGIVYFAAGNRLMFNEPHYNLPLLSILPKPLADIYIRLSGKADHYYEKHFTYWGLKYLVRSFTVIDYTEKVISNPQKYKTEYMVKPDSNKQKIAMLLSRYLIWLVPGYIWILEKPDI